MAEAEKAGAEAEAEEIEIRRTRIRLPTVEGEPEAEIRVTYRVKGLPPGLLTIPEKEWTAEKEVELIREDVKKRRETRPTTIRL